MNDKRNCTKVWQQECGPNKCEGCGKTEWFKLCKVKYLFSLCDAYMISPRDAAPHAVSRTASCRPTGPQ